MPTATSYVSAEEATNYFTNTGKAPEFLALSQEEKEAHLNYSTLYIDTNFTFGIIQRLPDIQALIFPKNRPPYLPENLKIATIELAELIRADNLFYQPGDQESIVTERKVGPITTKFERNQSNEIVRTSKTNSLDFIKDLLKDYISQSPYQISR